MKSRILSSIAMITLFTASAFPQAGSLDNTFNGDGKMLIEFNNTHDNGYTIIPQSDMTSVVYGGSINNPSDFFGTLFKLEENGDIDSTFGVDGAYTEILFGDRIYAKDMAQQADGKFVVSGVIDLGGGNEKFFAARYNTDGTHDAVFGTTGYFHSNYSSANSSCDAIAIQPDGKIVLAGRTTAGGGYTKLMFLRLNSDGTLDTGFGTNGYTIIDESIQDESINDLAFLSDGTIIGTGDAYVSNPIWGQQLIIAKLDQNGNPISSFGGNGVVIPGMMERVSSGQRIVVRNDSLFVAGYQYSATSNQDLVIIKMDSDAIGEPGFGTNGIVLINEEDWNFGTDLILQNDGKIFVSGMTGPTSLQSEFMLLRFLSDGTLDTDWDGDGIARTDFRVDSDEINSIGMQPDGKIIAVGFSLGLNSPPTEGNRIPLARYLNDYIPFQAEFSASDTMICAGSSVTFLDETVGGISRTWIFEGGDPASSTSANPTVMYTTAGRFDVILEASNGTLTDILTKTDYITVISDLPDQPILPTGLTTLCETESTEYTVYSVDHAYSYEWEVLPANAGTITGSDTVGYFTASNSWYGPYTVKVRGINICGNGPWSAELQCESFHMPEIFSLEGDGGYCTGSGGTELSLDSSETGINYELMRDGVPTGNIVAGTGSPISFGLVTDQGLYMAYGYNAICSISMIGQVWVHEVFPPDQPDQPNGPEEVCGLDSSYYYTNYDPDVVSYTWTLTPAEAGIITALGDSVKVIWDIQYSGIASMEVYGTNACGESLPSDPLNITVNETAYPNIFGPNLVCENTQQPYQTDQVSDNNYTWVVEGGNITNGAGTSSILVLWGDPGTGTILLTIVTSDGCTSTSEPFEVTIDECTTINEAERNDISIIPNPSNGTFYITGLKYDRVRIYDFSGTLILDSNITNSKLDLSDHPAGVYMVQIISEDRLIVRRLILK